MPEVFVGVDVCKAHLDVHVLGHEQFKRFDNNAQGLRRLFKFIRPASPALIVCEATGGYESQLLQKAWEGGLPIARVNAYRVRCFAESLGYLAKTDRIDAKCIAEYAKAAQIKAMKPPSELMVSLRELNQQRSALVEMKTAIKQRMRSFSVSGAIESSRRMLEELETEIAVLEDEIEEVIESDVELSEKAEILKSAKGVGPQTAAVLLGELPELGEVNGKEICALVGVAPYAKDSGQSGRKRHCRGGRKGARVALYMAAMSAKQHDPVMKAFYERLRGESKEYRVAMVACMRKLLVWLNAMVRDGALYDGALLQASGADI